MNKDRKFYILVGISSAVVILIFSISIYSYIRLDQPKSPEAVTDVEKKLTVSNPETSQEKTVSDQTQFAGKNEAQPPKKDPPKVNQDDQLDGPTTSERLRKVLSLREQPSEETIKLLTAFLDDVDSAVVLETIDTLGYLALNNDELKEVIFGILKNRALNKHFPEKGEALVMAAMFGMDDEFLSILPDFLNASGNQKEFSLKFVTRALSFVKSDDLVPYLYQIIEDSNDPKTQQNALAILSKFETAENLEFFANQLASNDELQQLNITWALSRTNDPEYNQLLSDAILNGQLDKESLDLLSKSPAAADVYEDLLSNEDLDWEKWLSILSSIKRNTVHAPKPDREKVARVLAPYVIDPEKAPPEVRSELPPTIGDIGGGDPAVEALWTVLNDPKKTDKERQSAFFGFIPNTTSENYQNHLEIISDKDPDMRRAAISIAGYFVQSSDADRLNDILKAEKSKNESDQDPFIIEQAERLLEKL